MNVLRWVSLSCAGVLLVGCRDSTAPEPEVARSDAAAGESAAALATSNTWSMKARMWSARSFSVAATTNGIMYVVGGGSSTAYATTTVQAYSVATNTWSTRKPLPVPRTFMNGASEISGRLYLTGGIGGDLGPPSKRLYVYDPGTNGWSRKRDMPVAGMDGIQAVVKGLLYVYIPMGVDYEGTFLRYTPATDTWKTLARPPTRHGMAQAGVINGKLYLVGGDGGPFYEIMNILSVYDPVTNTWTTKAPMNTPRDLFFAGVINGRLYVTGGGGPSDTRVTEVYDPAANRWTARASLPCYQDSGASAVAGGRLFVIGGGGGQGGDCHYYGLTRRVYAYTP